MCKEYYGGGVRKLVWSCSEDMKFNEKRTRNNIKTRKWSLGKGPNKSKQSRSGTINYITYRDPGNRMVTIG